MSNQIVISSGAKVRNLSGVLTGTSGIVNSLGINVPDGIPQLDGSGKILVSQLPNSVMEYKGTWNAATNTPTLANGTGNAGDVYLCNVAGTTNFGAGPITFAVGDQVLYSGTTWEKASGATGTVTSVAVTESGDALTITGSPITTSGTINIGFAGTGSQYIKGDGTLATFPTTIDQAKRLITEVYNSTGATLTKGTVVYINGGQGNLPTITKAQANSDNTSAQTYGVVQSDITNNNNGFVVVLGSLTDLDTQAYSVGTQLYLSGTTAGEWTSTKPSAPIHLVYVGIVVRSHPTQGVVEIRIQNGYELEELHDVAISSVANNDGIFYNSSNDLWENKTIAEVLGYTPQAQLTLTTTGTSGAATLVGSTLNIPQYTDAYTGTVTSVAMTVPTGLSVSGSPITTSGTLAVSLASGYSIPTTAKQTEWDTAYTNRITSASFPLSISSNAISISLASASTAGYLSIADWNTFNGKQNALTNPVTGTGNSGYVSIFTGTSTIGNSIIFQSTTRIGIMTSTPSTTLDVNGGGNFSGSIGALSFVKSGGTSSQFLKADGSVDSNTYISSLSASSPLSYNSGTGVISISAATGSTNGYLSSTDWLAFYAKQDAITLTTTGTSGPATLVGSTLNIPQYAAGVGGSGTTNYLPKFTGTSTIGNSAITDDGTTVTLISRVLQVGSYLNIYSGAYAAQTIPSIRASSSNNLILNAASTGTLYLNYETGSGGVYFGNGASGLKMLLDASGNLGLGVTPSAWGNSYKAFDISGGASIAGLSNGTFITSNAYDNGTNWIYKATSYATLNLAINGEHRWYNAPSGTAGNAISFTQAMTLASTGNLLINTTTDAGYKLDVNGTGRFSNAVNIFGANLAHAANKTVLSQEGSSNGAYWQSYGANTTTVGKFTLRQYSSDGSVSVIPLSIETTGAATFSSSVTAASLTLSSASTPLLQIVDTTNSKSLLFGADDNNTFIRSSSSTPIFLQVNAGDTAMTLTSSGNVLVGTSSSFHSAKLQVAGKIFLPSSAGVDYGGTIYGWNDTSRFPAEGGLKFQYFNYDGSSYAMRDGITLNGVGNVGIGTIDPASPLEVYKASGNNYIYATNGTSNTFNGLIVRYGSTNYGGIIGNPNTGEFRVGGFSVGGYYLTMYTDNTERARITSGGNVLIGTTTDSGYKLDVNGITKTNGLSLGATTFSSSTTMTSDYFFWEFTGGAGVTLTLYSSSGNNNTHFIKNSSGVSLTISGTIYTLSSGAPSSSITLGAYKTIQIISRAGGAWYIMYQTT